MVDIDSFKLRDGEPSKVFNFRKKWLKKNIELVNVTPLCEFRLGHSGSINDFNEPNEEAYHIQVWYRDENIGVISPTRAYMIDEDKYVLYLDDLTDVLGPDFIIFRKVMLPPKNVVPKSN